MHRVGVTEASTTQPCPMPQTCHTHTTYNLCNIGGQVQVLEDPWSHTLTLYTTPTGSCAQTRYIPQRTDFCWSKKRTLHALTSAQHKGQSQETAQH